MTTSNTTFNVAGITWTANADKDALTANAHGQRVSILKRGAKWTTSLRFSPKFDRANDAAKWVAKAVVAQAIFSRVERNRAEDNARRYGR